MELALIIYLIEFLSVKGFLSGCLIVFVVVSLVTYGIARMECFDHNDEERVNSVASKVFNAVKLPFYTLLIFCLFAPSSNTAYKMLAAYAGTEVLQMEEAKKVGGKAYEALNKVLDDYLEKREEK